MVTLGDTQLCSNFYCENCNYITSKKSSFNNHINSIKHSKGINGYKICLKYAQNMPKQITSNSSLVCECGKPYKHRQGLWRHKQICNIINHTTISYNNSNNISNNTNNKIENNMNMTSELVLELIKNNEELIKNNIDLTNTINNLVKNGITTNNNTINNVNNSHNNTFNLNVFLNETCKDAMNITDFIDSIKLQLSDFERIGEIGYTQGISDIITSNLQALDVTQRPVHCTDKKRETMYVKDENKWTKEENNKPKIRKMIKYIENKNIQVLSQFREKYPNYANPKSQESDKYNKTIIEAMGGTGNTEIKENKIIRNISKVTTVRMNE